MRFRPGPANSFSAGAVGEGDASGSGHTSREAICSQSHTPEALRVTRRRKSAGKPARKVVDGTSVVKVEPEGLSEKLGSKPLRLILVGHNPSAHAWASGHYYSNPSNWMWRLLKETGIAPPHVKGAQDDGLMPEFAEVGFVDVGCGVPGTDSSQFSSATIQGWAAGFYQRIAEQMQRAAQSIGCRCGSCGAPAIVAFTGKRQFMELLNAGKAGKAKIKSVPLGITELRPQDWPFPEATEVWVLTSTSGAAPMTVEQRKRPYQQLAERLASLPLGSRQTPCCDSGLKT